MNRIDFYGSPAYGTHNSLTLQPIAGFEVSNEIKTVDVMDALRGKIGEREDTVMSMVKLSPHGLASILDDQIAAFFAFQPADIGKLLFPGMDLPFIIQTKTGGTSDLGQSVTYAAAAISQPPELQFAPLKPLFGNVEWTCLKKNETAGDDDGAFVVVADSTYSEPSLDPADIVDTVYTVALGETFTGIETDEEGVRAAVKYTWTETKNASDGLLNFRLANVELEIRFRPVNIQVNDIHDALLLQDGESAGRGKLMSGRGLELTVTGANTGDPVLTVPCAVVVQEPSVFSDQPRSGEILLKAQRTFDESLAALFTLAVVVAP